MKKYLFIFGIFYANLLLAQQNPDLKLFRNYENYYLLKEKDTVAYINQLPEDHSLFNGKVAIVSKGNEFIFYRKNKAIDIHLNSSKRTFTLDGIEYYFVIDYTQNRLVLINGNKVILTVDGRNLESGIGINYYDGQPNVKLIYLAFMIKRDAKTKFVLKHTFFKIGALAAGIFSVYSILYLVK